MKLYLFRHGETEARDGMRYAEACEVPLSALGKRHAKALAKCVTKLGLQKIISSPIVRTKQTTEIILSKNNVSVSYDDRLMEHAPSRTAIGAAFKAAKKATRENYDFTPEDGESFNTAANRFLSVVHEIQNSEAQVIGIVSHALIMEAALVKLFSLSSIPKVDEASITLIEIKDGKPTLIFVNKRTWTLELFVRKLLQRFKLIS